MTKYVECWGADKPFANIAESTLAKNIGLTVRIALTRSSSYSTFPIAISTKIKNFTEHRHDRVESADE